MLESTFQIAPGVGPAKEQTLWARGIACWEDLLDAPSTTIALSRRRDPELRAAAGDARDALERGDADALAAMLPGGEHWRMLSAFAGDAAYLDIETGDDDVAFAGISAIGWFDRDGPRIFLAGRDLHLFPQVARSHSMLVTFNGLSFDVPILRRAFPDWTPPSLSRRSPARARARWVTTAGSSRSSARCTIWGWRVPRTWPASTGGTPVGCGGAGAGVTAIATRSASLPNTTSTT